MSQGRPWARPPGHQGLPELPADIFTPANAAREGDRLLKIGCQLTFLEEGSGTTDPEGSTLPRAWALEGQPWGLQEGGQQSPLPPETSLLQGQAWRVGSELCMILASGSMGGCLAV